MAHDSKGITQFYLPPTHQPYLPLLPSHRPSSPFGWYSVHLPMGGWPGWVDLGDWLYTEIGFLHRELNPGPVTHPSTNQTRRRVTSLIKTNTLKRKTNTATLQLHHKTNYLANKTTNRTRPSSRSSRLNKLEFSVTSFTLIIGSGMLVVKSPWVSQLITQNDQ